jgi:hypothetical protein
MSTSQWFEFEVSLTGQSAPVFIRMRDVEDRWAASVQCGATRTDALGATSRQALVSALAPFGARMSAAVLSAPMMFAASAQIVAARQAV